MRSQLRAGFITLSFVLSAVSMPALAQQTSGMSAMLLLLGLVMLCGRDAQVKRRRGPA